MADSLFLRLWRLWRIGFFLLDKAGGKGLDNYGFVVALGDNEGGALGEY